MPTQRRVKQAVKETLNKLSRRGGPQPQRRKNDKEAAARAAIDVLDGGKSHQEAAEAIGASELLVRVAVAREEGRRDPNIDPATLSLSAQQKFDAAIRQHKRQLDLEFDTRVGERLRELYAAWMPEYEQKLADAEYIVQSRKGVMDRPTFNLIRSCLHADSRKSTSDQKLNDAFIAFTKLEMALLKEAEMPTASIALPRSYEEAMERMRKVAEARKAKRAAAL